MLEIRNLACVRGGRTVFSGVEFKLEAGQILSLRGPNGSGKSTLIRLIAGFLPPATGNLSWAGQDIRSNAAEHRGRLHYVGHADGIKNALSVEENLAFACALNSADGETLVKALQHFDLQALTETPGRFLSSGQRRRLSLARLFAGGRPLWLLDEPGVGLDAANRDRLETAVHRHRDEGGITILATHGDVDVENTHVLEMSG